MRLFLVAVLLLASSALAGCSGGSTKDSDGDGLKDNTERNGWVRLTVDFLDRRVYVDVKSDIHKDDTDGDGLTDFDEFFQRTNPQEVDTDGDGLTDCQELLHSVRSECEDPEFTAHDNGTGTNPTRADSDAGPSRYVNGALGFVDETGGSSSQIAFGDGIADGEELAGYNVTLGDGRTRFVKTDPRDVDTDGDLLEDGEERFLYGSDPLVEDTDGDGCVDGRDAVPGSESRLRLGLKSFTLLSNPDGADDAQIHFEGAIEGRFFRTPFNDQIDVQEGVAAELTGRDPAAQELEECSLLAWSPWARIEIFAFDLDGTTDLEALDFFSESGNPADEGKQGTTVFWNLQTGQFAWTGVGNSPFSGPLEWQGENGRLVLHPFLL